MASKGLGYRSYEFDGFAILVGKGAEANDQLTFRVAKPNDWWMHAAGCPGSHVVIQNPDHLPTAPRAVLERAAELAAYYSKAREARGKVEIHLCHASDVRKPRGTPAGKVEIRRWDTLRVYPRAPDDE